MESETWTVADEVDQLRWYALMQPFVADQRNLNRAADALEEWHAIAKAHGDALAAQSAEVARLRAALALAVGELSTHGPMRYTSPEQLMQHFLEEARRER